MTHDTWCFFLLLFFFFFSYWCYYPHTLRYSVSPVWGIFIREGVCLAGRLSLLQGIVWIVVLRFILPCKSDCQSIFFKKQGINSLYTKLWLVRPLIKNVPDSSHQYLSNVTFRASLEYQMREQCFSFVFFFLNFMSRGVNRDVALL